MARGIPRAEIFVTTKIFTTHYNETLASEWVRSMLKELDLEYVDLVLMHAPRRNFGVCFFLCMCMIESGGWVILLF